MQKILVWDLPTRVGHWLMAISFVVAYITGESEEWRLVHAAAGGLLVGIVTFRVLWGFIGSRYARFKSFLGSPKSAIQYLRSLMSSKPEHHIGHNPAGGWAIMGLLVLGLATGITGWPLYQSQNGGLWEGLHEAVVNLMLGVVGIHLIGVLLGSLIHQENLVRFMVTGFKLGKPEAGIKNSMAKALPIMLIAGLLGAWWLSR